MDILPLISSYFPSLSKSEKKVAQYVLSNPDEVIKLQIKELAKLVSVGESTIIRFTRKIGYSGFQEFKIELAKYERTISDISIDNSNNIDKTYNNLITSLTETKDFISENAISEAASKILNANRLFLFGVGASGLTAQILSNRLKYLGFTVEYVIDGHLQSINAALTTANDVAIAISTSGNTTQIIQNIELVKSNKTPVISITNYIGSNITKVSDISLVVSSKEYLSNSGSFSATINQLYLLDVLMKLIVEKDEKRFDEVRKKINRSLMKHI